MRNQKNDTAETTTGLLEKGRHGNGPAMIHIIQSCAIHSPSWRLSLQLTGNSSVGSVHLFRDGQKAHTQEDKEA